VRSVNSTADSADNFCIDNPSRGGGFRYDRLLANRIETVPGLAAHTSPKSKSRPEAAVLLVPENPGIGLADERSIRARYRHHLAGLNDMRGLAVIRIGSGGDAQARHHDAGNKCHNYDLQVRTTVC
jgi:hypothetical protein